MSDDTDPGPWGQGAFELRYRLEADDLEDLIAAQQTALNSGTRSSRRLPRIAGTVMAGAAVGITIALMEDRGLVSYRDVVAFAFGGFVLAVVFLAYYFGFYVPAYIRKIVELNRLVGVAIELKADAAGLRASTPDTRMVYDWTAVERIDDNPQRILIWVSGLMAVIVPKGTFRDLSEEAAFLAALRRWADVES